MCRLVFSRVNSCWFLMFGSSVVEIFHSMDRDAVHSELRCRGLVVSRCGIVSAR